MGHDHRVRDEFAYQAERFNSAPIFTAAETLQALIDLLPLERTATWLEAACGPGIVSRALAPLVGSVLGIDLTPTMVDVANREAARAGVTNAHFTVGDATALDLPDANVDGAVTRFSLHHVPLPGRVVGELRRVVRQGGWVCLADHITSDNAGEMAWHQEIERLRDPSHWACLTPARLRDLGHAAGLTLRDERLIPVSLDFDEWLTRGSGGPGAAALIAAALAARPAGIDGYRVRAAGDGGRRIETLYHVTLWQRTT
ncbi:MAG: class I SAM-dependent methyltransferase [Chloroflexi bacterium]|nr:class I SAM-dependent methyltransferase [Chloroflexota bacterium]